MKEELVPRQEAYKEYAKALNKRVEELTIEEKKQAFQKKAIEVVKRMYSTDKEGSQ